MDGARRPRLLRAVVAAGVTGAVVLGVVRYAALPALWRGLSAAQIEFLRNAFRVHPVWVLAAIVAIAGLLSVPVLLAAIWAARSGS
jgi:hypothetical protein